MAKKKKVVTKKKAATKKKGAARKKQAGTEKKQVTTEKQSPETDSAEDTAKGLSTMEVPKSVLALHKIADPESRRYALGQTRIENHNGEVGAVVTDGRRMVALFWRERVPESRGLKPVALSYSSAKTLHGQATKAAPIVLRCNDGGESLTASCPNGTSMEVEETEGKFPEWQQTIPPDEEKAVSVKLDLDLFIGMLQAVRDHVVDEEGCSKAEFQILGEEKAVKVTTAQGADGQSGVAVLMPIWKS